MDYALFQEMRGSKTANSSSSKRFTPNVRALFAMSEPPLELCRPRYREQVVQITAPEFESATGAANPG